MPFLEDESDQGLMPLRTAVAPATGMTKTAFSPEALSFLGRTSEDLAPLPDITPPLGPKKEQAMPAASPIFSPEAQAFLKTPLAPLETEPEKKMGTPERLGRHFVSGALGTAEGMGGALQWISGGALGKDFADYMGGLREKVTPEGEPSFVEQLASGAGSMATFFIPGFGVARGLGLAGRIAPRAAQWLGAGTMAVTEAATEAGQVYRDEMEKGKREGLAGNAATWTFWLNLPVLTLTDKLAFFGNEGKVLARALRGMVTEGSQESLQEVISTWSKEEQQNLKNILTSGAIGAILGGGFGAISRPVPQKPYQDRLGEEQERQREEARLYDETLLGAKEAAARREIVRPVRPPEEVEVPYPYVTRDLRGQPRVEQEIPPGETPLVDEMGRPIRPTEEEARLQEILAKQPWERTAEEKLWADRYQRELEALGETIAGELRPAPQRLIVPPAFGGPRPATPAPMGVTGSETMEAGRPKPEVPPLGERVGQLIGMVEETGDPNAARELNRLLIANQKEIGDFFRVPEREIPGLQPIADRLETLIRQVEETGNLGAARELHGLLAANREILSGVTRREIARRSGLPQPPMGLSGADVAETATKKEITPAPRAAEPAGVVPPSPETPTAAPEPTIAESPEPQETWRNHPLIRDWESRGWEVARPRTEATKRDLQGEGWEPSVSLLGIWIKKGTTRVAPEPEDALEGIKSAIDERNLRQGNPLEGVNLEKETIRTLAADYPSRQDLVDDLEETRFTAEGYELSPELKKYILDLTDKNPELSPWKASMAQEAKPAIPTSRSVNAPQEPSSAFLEGVQEGTAKKTVPETPVEIKMRVQNVPVKDISTDPDRFQYKLGSEEGTGAGLALRDVKKWDEGLSGILTLWRAPDGALFVVNGHQRLALAKKLGVDTVRTQILDSSEWTDRDARAYGAKINIAEGRGTEVDAAKFMRDTGLTAQDLANEGISLSEAKTRRAIALSELSDPIFHDLTIGQFPIEQAVLIGENLSGNHPAQNSIFTTIKNMASRGQSITNTRLRELLLLGKSAATTSMKQATLFGEEELKGSLLMESTDLMDYGKRQLRQDVHLFGLVGRKAGRLKQAGNTIDPETNQLISKESAEAIALVNKFAYYGNTESGKVLNEFAARLAEAGTKGEEGRIRKDFYEELKRAVAKDRAGFGLGKGPRFRLEKEESKTGGLAPERPGTVAGEPEAGQVQAPPVEGSPSLAEKAFGLQSKGKKPSKLENRLNALQADYPDIDRDRAATVLRAFPDAGDAQIAAMSADPEMFAQVARGNLAATERTQLLKKATDAGAQMGLIDTGRGETLFQIGEKSALMPGEGGPVTLEAVQESFGGVEVQEVAKNQGFHLTLPSGKVMVILTSKDPAASREQILRTYGREMQEGEWVAGEWQHMSVGGVMALAKGAGTRTLNHELLHAAADLVATKREIKALLRDKGDWETAARDYETWEPKKGPSNPVFKKVWNFFRRLAYLLRPNAEGFYERLRSGEVWLRTEAGPGTGQTGMFRIAPEEAILERYHRDLMAQDPSGKSLWHRFWDRDPTLKSSWEEFKERAYNQVVDRFAPGERAQEKLAKAGIALPAGERFTSAVAFWRGQEGWNHEAVLSSGVYHDPVETLGSGESFFSGGTPIKVGDSLFKRVESLRDLAKNRGVKNKEAFRDLRLLMVAQRDLELAGETGVREPGEIKGVRPEESRAALQALETKYGQDFSRLQEVADNIREWADQAILQRLLQADIITRELYDQIKARNQAYIPFLRLMDELDQYLKNSGGGRVIQEIKGSERLILDPLQSLMELAAKANYAYAKNRMYRSLYLMGRASPEMGIEVLKSKIVPSGLTLKEKWEPLGRSGWAMAKAAPTEKTGWAFSPLPPEKGAVPFYLDGKRVWLKLPPDMHQMTHNLLPEDLGLLMRVLKWPADVLRTGAVTTPEFGLIKNPLRDLIQAWLFNRAGFSPHKWFRDLYLSLAKDPATMQMRAEMAAGGGFMATLAQATVEEKITAEDIEGKKKNIFYSSHPVEALRRLSAYLENLTRFSIYKQARENGLSHAEAIHEARRTTLDFRRLGAHPVARYLNMIIPFWNANIQGVDKLVTELRGPNKAAVWRRIAALSAASIGLALLFHDDDRLKELEDWEKNYFWHIPLGKDGPIIRLPKPFEAGILFGSVPERLVEVAKGDNPTGLQAALRAAYDAMTPEMIPAALRPLVELKSNYNFFLGRPIEDVSLQNLPVELRAKPWTSQLAKAISAHGGNLVGLSPVKVEHFVRTFSGGLGANYMFPGADVLLRKAGILEDLPQPQQDAIERAFGIRALFTKPPVGYRAKSVGDFFENYQNIVQADQGWKILWNTGSMDKLDQFLADNPDAMFARVARKQMAEMGKIKKERNAVHLSKTLTPEQKRTKLDALDKKIVTLARSGNILMDTEVAQTLKMPSRFRRDEVGMRKSLDLDGYYKFVAESVGDAYDAIQKDLPRLLRMDESQRQRFLIKTIRQAREDYRPVLKRPEDVTKPYRFSNLFDKPTRAERARWQEMMEFRKIPPGAASGFRMKEKETHHAPI